MTTPETLALARAIQITADPAVAGDDDFSLDYRSLLIEDDAAVEAAGRMTPLLRELAGLLAVIRADPYEGREWLTAQLLDYSLCPLHGCDYAICFDDENPECDAIRRVHPMHDV